MAFIGWYGIRAGFHVDEPPPAIINSGSVDNRSTRQYAAGIVGYTTGVVVWTKVWTPVVADAEPETQFPAFIGSGFVADAIKINSPSGTTPTNYGTILLTATLDGIACDGVLRLVFINNGTGLYGGVAWDRFLGVPSALWTDFKNTYEVP